MRGAQGEGTERCECVGGNMKTNGSWVSLALAK